MKLITKNRLLQTKRSSVLFYNFVLNGTAYVLYGTAKHDQGSAETVAGEQEDHRLVCRLQHNFCRQGAGAISYSCLEVGKFLII